MILTHRPPFRSLVAGLATLLLFAGLILPGPAEGQQPAPEQQIAEIEKQIEALTKKLNDLRKAGGMPTSAPDGTFPAEWLKHLPWRSIGPATMGGRITAISVFEADPSTWFVATASGGLLKTINNGVTFEHVFDHESTVSIGDVCVAPSDRNIVWVGTGENNPRNSVSYGDGVYKSTDGGKTWKNMGLKKSFQIGRIAIHPKDPNIVYVGALGRLYGPNEERGLFKTTDGGKTWDKVLYVDDKTGIIDVQISPADPETLLAATWERQRDEFDSFRGDASVPEGADGYAPVKKWAPGSGIWKSTTGGKSFQRMTQGLPTCNLGRIGLCWSRKTPGTAFAIVDCEKIGMGPPQAMVADVYLGIQGEDAETGARLTQISDNSPASKAGLQAGDIVLGIDTKTILGYQQLVEQIKGHKPGDKLTARIARKKELKEIAITLEARPGSQASKTHPFGSRLNSQVENVQAKQGKEGFQYGGVYKTTDGGDTWVRINSLNPRPMYFSQVRVDPSDDNRIYVLGIALYRSSDGGKTFKSDGGKGAHPDHHALWIDPRDGRHMILGTDGGFYATYDRMEHWDYLNTTALGQFYHVAVDMRKPYYVYGGLQDNGSWGGPSRSLHGSGPTNDDWFLLGGGDGFVCRIDPIDSDIVYYEAQDGNMARRNLRTGEWARIQPKTAKGAPPYRFNWNAPYILSSHNPRIVYCAGNYVFRSVKQGDDLRPISPEITRTKRGSGTALAESPRNPEVLWAGTDDGALWVTRDGGIKWTNVADKIGLPGPRWVSSIEASRFVEGRAYVVFDAHRSDDDQPYVYVTEDFGQTWKSLNANLPWGSTRVLREDAVNPNLLYLGTEFAVWVSLDRGQTWHKLNNNLPTVAVHEIAVHPTAGEIVAATHGRSLWILDVVPLRQMTAEVARQKAHLFEPRPVVRWRSEPSKGSPFGTGSRNFVGQNPPRGAQIYYSLSQKAEKVGLKIVDAAGKTVRELQAKGDPGLHRVTWDLMTGPPRPQGPGGGSGGRRPMGEGGGERPMGEQPAPTAVPAGQYRLVLSVDGTDYAQNLRVETDPIMPTAIAAPEEQSGARKAGSEQRIDD